MTKNDNSQTSQIRQKLIDRRKLEAEKLKRDREYEEEMRLQYEAEDVGENYWDENPAINY
mgnify:CR=1 FL=1|tara:strand:+ start:3374 stop:3553 length:180 start_codon:yes stop_codon:yes gene_type:complete